MVITAGTGSGKTEAFFLPVVNALLAESERWEPLRGAARNAGGAGPARSSRSATGETGPRAAVRCLVLYPMNALVEDQLMRLRRALDGPAARHVARRAPRAATASTSAATPARPRVRAASGTRSRAAEPARRSCARWKRAPSKASATTTSATGDERKRYFVPRLDGAEMRSRWDMQAHPPDILITNYSMLNVMLLRERDEPFFDETPRWLDDDPVARVHPRRRRAAHVPRARGKRGRVPPPQPAPPARTRPAGPSRSGSSPRAPRSRRARRRVPRRLLRCARRARSLSFAGETVDADQQRRTRSTPHSAAFAARSDGSRRLPRRRPQLLARPGAQGRAAERARSENGAPRRAELVRRLRRALFPRRDGAEQRARR